MDARTVSIEEASKALGIGRTLGYAMARRGTFPARVLRLGRLYRVPTADLRRVLGETAEAPASR